MTQAVPMQPVPSTEPSGPSTPVPEQGRQNQLDTFGGVFTPTLLTILGVILFMRAGFVVGEAGMVNAVVILLLAKLITFLTSLSISAVATNMQVRGGGSYFLISRVLGPEFGGAIGLSLFLATALSVPFYIIGFIEALLLNFPTLAPWALPIGLLTTGGLLFVAWVGAEWAVKVQYIILTVLLLSIVVFLGGALCQFSPEHVMANLAPKFTRINPMDLDSDRYNFWLIFAIYFPAVTGINAGLNMSGDLKDPNRSLPKGTLLAVLVGFIIYLLQIVLTGGAFDRAVLVRDPFKVLLDNALFGWGFLVTAGVFAATLSSALGSILGAPRVLQALARDPILSMLKPFAKGTAKGDEPRRALILTAAITSGVLWWAYGASGGDALNAIAAIITMFFLYTYGVINMAAFIEGAGNNPSFRPRFKFFHWSTAMVGALGCLFVAFLINFTAALVAAVLITSLVLYLWTSQTQASFGDARRGFVYASARRSMLKLADMAEDAKNWRPTMLVFCGNPANREALVSYAIWLSSGRGMTFLANVIIGQVKNCLAQRKAALKQLRDFCREKRIQAFASVVIADSIESGIETQIQTCGSGFIHPNLVVFGWRGDPEDIHRYVEQLRIAQSLGMSIVIMNIRHLPSPLMRKHIHIWWRGKANGHLMMILGFLLSDNWEWGNSKITVLQMVRDEAGQQPALDNMSALIQDARIDATAQVVVGGGQSFEDVMVNHSSHADCVFMGFQIPDDDLEREWHHFYKRVLEQLPSTILVHSALESDLLSG
ncbi:MAG: amino acid permease [Cyanobacteria bacterium HKST-UBA04]|nr:amino acid permease [Cyanobacteria bacterium HKST-UBA04]